MVTRRNDIPRIWLISDARNDAVLERAIRQLPPGSGVVFRHKQLDKMSLACRYRAISRLCRARNITLLRGFADPLAKAHSLKELGKTGIRAGNRPKAVLLSPVYPTRSHPGAPALGEVRFLLMARQSRLPVIALGGVTRSRARRLMAAGKGHLIWGWAAIDGLSSHR